MDEIKVVINGTEYKAKKGEALAGLLRGAGFDRFVCGGHGRCGKCRVVFTENAPTPSETELKTLSEDEIAGGVRLACRVTLTEDCAIFTEKGAATNIVTGGVKKEFPILPAFKKFGVAVDVGTTTVAARLYDANGRLLASSCGENPQKAFGADVVSRMEAAVGGNAPALAALIRGKINGLIDELCESAKVNKSEIDGGVITGNTVMLHFLTATSVEPLTHAPFAVKRLFGDVVRSYEIGISGDFPVYLPPCVSAFVGADISCALTSVGDELSGVCLLIDIGTNGEEALYKNGGFFVCSTAAGPAFEGAGISCGMGGGAGAVDKVKYENGALKAHVIGDAAPKGVCGSGIIDAVTALLDSGDVDETGFMGKGEVEIAAPVTISQKDVRAVQLAKSAVHAGMLTLLHRAGLTPKDVDRLYIAGGFGSFIDVKSAARIGLIPKEFESKVIVLGNAALEGASELLLCEPLRESCEERAKRCELVELASDGFFADEYIDKMGFEK